MPVDAPPNAAPIGPSSGVLPDGTVVHGGRRYVVDVGDDVEIVQRYMASTPVVETVFVTPTGVTGVIDFVWQDDLVRIVVEHTGHLHLRADHGGPGDDRRVTALRHWFGLQPELPESAEREVGLLSVTIAAACGAEPGAMRSPDEVDALGLWRRADGTADLGAHAAYARTLVA